MYRWGHLILTLRPGEFLPHVPNHLDCLLGACRPVSRLDGGPIDQVLQRWGNGFRASGVYHARQSFGHIGEQNVGFNDLEEALGFPRTYQIEIGEASQTKKVVHALRDLAQIERVNGQTLASVPFTRAPVSSHRPRKLAKPLIRESHQRVHALEALALEPGDERITVAVIDTGVALGHLELRGKLLAGCDTVDLGMGRVNPFVKLVGDSLGRDFTPQDEVDHGSHVSGIVGARGLQIAPGISGRSLILPIRVLAAAIAGKNETGKIIGIGALSDIDEGIKAAVDLGADVINMSFGTPESKVDPYGPRPHAEVVRYATHYGCVLVAAIGNSGAHERYFPAVLPEVIAVGSVNEHGKRSSFSTFGDHIALCAPGERIISIGRRGYKESTGTSHAAPFVTGAAALLLSRARRVGRKLEGADVKRLLIESASPLSGGGFNPETGYGLLNALAALRRLDQALAGSQPVGRPE
jgi:subtilisin family serine protease